jgi:hypothetical protein
LKIPKSNQLAVYFLNFEPLSKRLQEPEKPPGFSTLKRKETDVEKHTAFRNKDNKLENGLSIKIMKWAVSSSSRDL